MRIMIAAIVVALSCVQFASAQPNLTRENPVNMTAIAEKIGDDGKQIVKIQLRIKKGVEYYASFSNEQLKYFAINIVARTSDGKTVPAKFNYPKGIRVEDKSVGDYYVYRGNVTIGAILDRNGITGPVRLTCPVRGSVRLFG